MEDFSTILTELLASGQLETATVAATATVVVILLRKLPGRALGFVKKVIIKVADKLKG